MMEIIYYMLLQGKQIRLLLQNIGVSNIATNHKIEENLRVIIFIPNICIVFSIDKFLEPNLK